MHKKQRELVVNFVITVFITTAVVVGLVIFRDWVNKSEAMRAMEHLGEIVLQYRKDNGAIPPQSYVDSIKERLKGYARLGDLKYRARWIGFGSGKDEIIAYTKKDYKFLSDGQGVIVLRLNGVVEWLKQNEFERTLSGQQSPIEIETMGN